MKIELESATVYFGMSSATLTPRGGGGGDDILTKEPHHVVVEEVRFRWGVEAAKKVLLGMRFAGIEVPDTVERCTVETAKAGKRVHEQNIEQCTIYWSPDPEKEASTVYCKVTNRCLVIHRNHNAVLSWVERRLGLAARYTCEAFVRGFSETMESRTNDILKFWETV